PVALGRICISREVLAEETVEITVGAEQAAEIGKGHFLAFTFHQWIAAGGEIATGRVYLIIEGLRELGVSSVGHIALERTCGLQYHVRERFWQAQRIVFKIGNLNLD